MPAIKRVSAYEVDGVTFGTKAEAKAYQARALLSQIMDEGSVCQGGEWDAGMVRDWMIGEGWRLINALSDIARRGAGAK